MSRCDRRSHFGKCKPDLTSLVIGTLPTIISRHWFSSRCYRRWHSAKCKPDLTFS